MEKIETIAPNEKRDEVVTHVVLKEKKEEIVEENVNPKQEEKGYEFVDKQSPDKLVNTTNPSTYGIIIIIIIYEDIRFYEIV